MKPSEQLKDAVREIISLHFEDFFEEVKLDHQDGTFYILDTEVLGGEMAREVKADLSETESHQASVNQWFERGR